VTRARKALVLARSEKALAIKKQQTDFKTHRAWRIYHLNNFKQTGEPVCCGNRSYQETP